MAVSPADFYAYSRATGAPLPENPEERARMAPEVLAYRRNQLKAPQQEQQQGPDPLTVGLGIGLGLAGLGGAALGMRRLMRGPKQSVTAGVQQANLAEMAAEMSPVRRVAQETQPAPSQTPPGPSRQEIYARVAAKPESELPTVHRPQGGVEVELITDPNTGEIFRRGKSPESFAQTYVGLRTPLTGQKTDLPTARTPGTFAEFSQAAEQRFSPRQYIEQTGAVAPVEDLTSVQQANTYQITDQKINAVESGEDQMTGRMRQQLQRNEDLNVADIDALEDLTGNINVAASQTTDGLPVDQAGQKTFVQQFLQNERDEIMSQMGELGLSSPSLVDKELARRLGTESFEYGREYTKVKQMIESGLEDPRYLQASEPLLTRIVAGQEFPVTVKDVMQDEPSLAFRKPFISEKTAIASEQDFVNKQNEVKNWLGSIRVEVEPQINKLNQIQDELLQQQNMLLYTLNKQPDAELGRQLKFVANQIKQNNNQLDFLNKRLSGATQKAQESLESISKWTPSTLVDWSGEGTVVRPKRTVPDTMSFEAEGGEISNIERGSRMAQPGPEDLEIVPGGLLSGGRAKVLPNIGEQIAFDPTTGQSVLVPLVDPETGEDIVQKLAGKRMGEDIGVRGRGGSAGLGTRSSVGIYGTELSEYGTGAQTKSGQYTEAASQAPSLVNPEPVQRKTGGYFTYPQQRETAPQKFTQEATPQRLASVELSEQVRKSADPQAFLQQEMQKRGISAIGQFSPWPRRNR